MFSRKLVRRSSYFLLFCLLAWYSEVFLRESGEDFLVCLWNRTFHRLGADCIYWIAMRLAAWLSVYLHLLRLESGFSIYLFLRRRSYGSVFLHIYAGCVGRAVCYYGVGTAVMAVFHSLTVFGGNSGVLLQRSGLPFLLAEEGLEALSFCLAAYALHCIFGKAEAGFLAVLAGRLLLNFVTGGERPALPVQLAVNLIMVCAVFFLAFRDFAEKYADR
ncbi:MAG: hypothetical protein NC432_09755 [Roseburia sp.]|nr:hypothetical protein [Roseburia sp.]MCM1096800.1 hypothetical protein [Ruminococcus flavefaciens]